MYSHRRGDLTGRAGERGGMPRRRLLQGAGALRLAALLAAACFSTGAVAQQLTTLYSFTGGDGANPAAGLMADPAGNLYGTTLNGGASGQGTVFQLDPSGN